MRAQVAILIAAVLVLCGCVAQPPAGPTAEQIAAQSERMREQTWQNTGLSGEAPAVAQSTVLTMDEWTQFVFACMGDSGIGDYSLSYGPSSGWALFGPTGGSASDDEQLAFYSCAAVHGMVDSDELLTDEQLDYVYDYYLRSLVPCMVMNGFRPTSAPTRVEFLALAGHWSPYYSVDVGISAIQYEQIEQTCGPERPQLYG